MKILSVNARQVMDCRGTPTVEAEIKTSEGYGRAIVPSGASTGAHEAVELRDGAKAFLGKGVSKAVNNVNTTIKKNIVGKSFDQEELDRLLCKIDGTPNKSRLGANATLAVSMAFCRATKMPLYKTIAKMTGNKPRLPVPFFNIINGGKHAANKLDFQEYMLAPAHAKNYSEALQIGSEVYHTLQKLLKKNGQMTNVGDEGGFAPQFTCIEEPFDFILNAVDELGYGKKIELAIDAAATSFYAKGKYSIEGNPISTIELTNQYLEMIKSYGLYSIEDPFQEEDFEAFERLTKNSKIQIVGDDLTVTNPLRIQKAIEHNSCNCLLLKVNQIGTITEALDAAKLATKNGWKIMVSHRSGDSEDSFIADLAVGLGCGQIKSGAPCRSERLAKYNQLLRIEEELGKKTW